MHLPPLNLPPSLNYIAVFLTLNCNLNCSYCINDPMQAGQRRDLFKNHGEVMSPAQWARGLARIPFRADLPITLQGGEPMLYWAGEGIGMILEALPHYFDLLTNMAVRPDRFIGTLRGQQRKFQRDAPYPSIRVSYHPKEMEQAWRGRGFEELVDRCCALVEGGFRVSPVKADSDVGIYMVEHPENAVTEKMREIFTGRIPFELKEFLGTHDGRLYGTYKYPYSTNLIVSGAHSTTIACECRTSELLLDPLGFVWGCHSYLYEKWTSSAPHAQYAELSAKDFLFTRTADALFGGENLQPIGHILDPDFSFDVLRQFRKCHFYGRCIGCDTKIKNNRFQSLFDANQAHTSVEIRNIEFPPGLEDGDLRIDGKVTSSR